MNIENHWKQGGWPWLQVYVEFKEEKNLELSSLCQAQLGVKETDRMSALKELKVCVDR